MVTIVVLAAVLASGARAGVVAFAGPSIGCGQIGTSLDRKVTARAAAEAIWHVDSPDPRFPQIQEAA